MHRLFHTPIAISLLCLLSFFPPFGGTKGFCQDFHLSQYDAATFYMNPALTGKFAGDHRAHLHYRNQWASLNIKPFITTAISYDKPSGKNSGFGIMLLNDRAGLGSYNVLNLLLSGSYDLSLFINKPHRIAAGVHAGFISKSVNMDNLYFHNQYSSSGGGIFNTSLASGEESFLSGKNVFLPEINAGILYYYSSVKSRLNPFAGFSAFHLTSPQESFYGVRNKLPRRYLFHVGLRINITGNLQLFPKFLIMRQVNAGENDYGMDLNYYLPSSRTWIIAGIMYRNRDALSAVTGVRYGKFLYRFSYDINVSTLKEYSNGRGAYEFSVTWITGKIKNIPPSPCLRY